MTVTVEDNGGGIQPERLAEIRGRLERRERVEEESGRGNVGLKNIHDRIRLYYGDVYGIVIDSFRGRVCQDTFCGFSKLNDLSVKKSPKTSCLQMS